MPKVDSIEICQQLRHFNPRLPVLILSDFDCLDHKVEALETGADDYIILPVSERELNARLHAAIRRSRIAAIPTSKRLVVGEIVLDPIKHRVEKSGSEILLSPREFHARHVLMEHAGEPIPHSALLNMLWGPDKIPYRERLRVLIGGLRKKIEDDHAHPVYLLTHHQYGYIFVTCEQGVGL